MSSYILSAILGILGLVVGGVAVSLLLNHNSKPSSKRNSSRSSNPNSTVRNLLWKNPKARQ